MLDRFRTLLARHARQYVLRFAAAGLTRHTSPPLVVLLLLALAAVSSVATAHAQSAAPPTPVLGRGDAVVTGFPGIRPVPVPVFPGTNPLDHFLVDADGIAAQILSLRQMPGAPLGQLTSPPPLLQLKAGTVGLVFAIALDDGRDRSAPDIYLGQSSAFGLHIVDPDGLGPGRSKRLTRGKSGARWMPAQLGSASAPGAIWRIDGVTGRATLFATLPANSGPGLGDIVFDTRSGSFYASDLDSGLIHRLSREGRLLDTFDHGVAGRPQRSLAPVADDRLAADITSAAFAVADPQTWGLTQPARRVGGLAVHDGRLYYAVMEGLQVWSVGLAPDGRIGSDPRWELDAAAANGPAPAAGTQISDMLFDGENRMVLALRGAQRGAYDFSVYAEPGRSLVLRYRLKAANEPPGPSRWAAADEYATGLPVEHRADTGGIALGYGHDANGRLDGGKCNAMLWMSGDRLRPPTLTGDVPDATTDFDDVHGLQGNEIGLVKPRNVPPRQAYYVDFDGLSGDAEKAGHVGDVEIWQPCNQTDYVEPTPAPGVSRLPPGYMPPRATPPADVPADYPPPGIAASANLRLTKRILSDTCVAWGGGHACFYRVRIRNSGPDAYHGPLLIDDWLPLAPAGAGFGFAAAGWTCWATGPAAHRCWRPATYLGPGQSLALTVATWVPGGYPFCHVQNAAALVWAPGGTRWNSDPLDDVDVASGRMPAPHCPAPSGLADLSLKMELAAGSCTASVGAASCVFHIQIANNGPGLFQGPLSFSDLPMDGANPTFSAFAGWTCGAGGGAWQCTQASLTLYPGETRVISAQVKAPLATVAANGCRIDNAARLSPGAGNGPVDHQPANDAAGASGRVDGPLCVLKVIAPKAVSCPAGWQVENGQCVSRQQRLLSPGVPPVVIPPVVLPPSRPPTITPPAPPVVPTRCPQGTVGIFPDCRQIEPERCPDGTRGTPPNCRRIEPERCPDGTRGTPPNCRKVEPPKSEKPPKERPQKETPQREKPQSEKPQREKPQNDRPQREKSSSRGDGGSSGQRSGSERSGSANRGNDRSIPRSGNQGGDRGGNRNIPR